MFFSCIVTCYNREKIILRALESILKQTHQDFEIIIIDDASNDKSVEMILTIKDPRIKLIRNEINHGQNFSLNVGVNDSKYEILAFLDSDDTWEKTYLEEMNTIYTEHPTIGFAYANLANGPIWTLEGENKYGDVLHQGFLSSMISITAKKSAINEVGNFDLRYSICQDDDFCFRLAKKFSFKVIQKPLSIIHGAENSMTRNSINVVKGWAFLFHNYKTDILFFCGSKTFAKHMLMVAKLYFTSNNFLNGVKYYLLALFFMIKPTHHKYQFSFNFFLVESIDILKLMIKKMKNKLLKV